MLDMNETCGQFLASITNCMYQSLVLRGVKKNATVIHCAIKMIMYGDL